MVSIATVLKSIERDPGMNLPVKFHQNRLTPLASRAVHYIQTYKQTNIHTNIQTDGKTENKGSLATTNDRFYAYANKVALGIVFSGCPSIRP